MNFLEAKRIVSNFTGGKTLSFLLAASGTTAPFEIYLGAAAATRGRTLQVSTLPFGTLAQTLHEPPIPGQTEVFLLIPWDFAPETDWRSGLPAGEVDFAQLRQRAELTASLLRKRRGARLLYLPAPVLPIFPDRAANTELASFLVGLASSVGARILAPDAFSLSSLLATGCAVGGASLGDVAECIVQQAHATAPETCKVLITDLDNCLWGGVVAEDGPTGILFAPESSGYKHFIYQTLLIKLKREGALLCAVSRNDPEIGLEPLRNESMPLRGNDFVCAVCSYNAKSAQVREIANRLNVGLDSLVFVDDNPVELAEVSSQVPEVHCLQFPSHDEGLVPLFAELSRLFARETVTPEDRARTEMYRRGLETMVPVEVEGADITGFLRGLQMTLTVHDRTSGGHDRAVQLINKTNQFNLNGRRVTDKDIADALSAGARLYTATLDDRNGTHGEILACLISREGVVQSFVMSCRVFQRRVEHAFLVWLAAQAQLPSGLDFLPTHRNEPLRNFLKDPAFAVNGDLVRFDAARFASAHAGDHALFTVKGPAD
jgi:FkbH-like protein